MDRARLTSALSILCLVGSTMRSVLLLAAAWFATLSVPAWCQEVTEQPAPPPAKVDEKVPPPPMPERIPDRDPTVPEGELKNALEPDEVQPTTRPNVVSPPVYVVPSISVGGKVIGRRGAAVLLNIGKDYPIFVRANSEVTITQDGRPLTLAVLAVTLDVVEIEIRPLKRRLTLP